MVSKPRPPKAVGVSTHVLILGTADWNQLIPTNQHYITRELAKQTGAVVTFVESLALRSPELSVRDVARIGRRLRAVATGHRTPGGSNRVVPDGVTVASPLVAPASWRIAHPVNSLSLRRTVRAWRNHTGKRVLWTYTPVTYGLDSLADATVYHCVDLLGQFAGIDPKLTDEFERLLANAGAMAIASSDVVRAHLRQRGFAEPLLWENVADTDLFAGALTGAPPRVARRAIFAGNLTPKKVDYSVLVALVEAGWQVAVAGPRAEGGGRDDHEFDDLQAAGVEYLGMLDATELAQELARATLGLIPYTLTPYTRGVSPLKTYEYLASGLGVVATDLPGVHGVPGMIERASDSADFVDRAEQFSALPAEEEVIARVTLAHEHSWLGRGEQARTLLRSLTETLSSGVSRPTGHP